MWLRVNISFVGQQFDHFCQILKSIVAVAHYGRVDDSPYSMGEQNVTCVPKFVLTTKTRYKGALSWYGKLTWESAHAWNLIILCLLIVWGMTFIFMVHLSFYAIPLLIYDVMYDITTIP